MLCFLNNIFIFIFTDIIEKNWKQNEVIGFDTHKAIKSSNLFLYRKQRVIDIWKNYPTDSYS